MILSDLSIREEIQSGNLVIDPFPLNEAFQPASVDLRLNDKDDFQPKLCKRRYVGNDNGNKYKTLLYPGQFVLTSTLERVEIPNYLSARVEGKSSLGRKGLMVHVTAGFIDPGFKGNITLELKNLSSSIIFLKPGMYISQICFMRLDGKVLRPYGSEGLKSRYQNSVGLVRSIDD